MPPALVTGGRDHCAVLQTAWLCPDRPFNISCGVRVHFPQPAETWVLLVTANSPHQAAERKDQAKAEKDSRAQGRIERRVKKPLYYLGYLLPSQAPPACLLPACPPALRYCPLTISKHGHSFGALARLPVALTLCHTLNRSLAPTVPPSFGFPPSPLSHSKEARAFSHRPPRRLCTCACCVWPDPAPTARTDTATPSFASVSHPHRPATDATLASRRVTTHQIIYHS